MKVELEDIDKKMDLAEGVILQLHQRVENAKEWLKDAEHDLNKLKILDNELDESSEKGIGDLGESLDLWLAEYSSY